MGNGGNRDVQTEVPDTVRNHGVGLSFRKDTSERLGGKD